MMNFSMTSDCLSMCQAMISYHFVSFPKMFFITDTEVMTGNEGDRDATVVHDLT